MTNPFNIFEIFTGGGRCGTKWFNDNKDEKIIILPDEEAWPLPKSRRKEEWSPPTRSGQPTKIYRIYKKLKDEI